MDDVIRLSAYLPEYFFSSIRWPFALGPFTAVPALGVICLAVGSLLGVVRRQPRLLVFLIPVAASQALVVVAGLLGEPGFWGADGGIYTIFLVLQIILASVLFSRAQSAMPAAAALAVFSFAYAFAAVVVAATAFHVPTP
ncbi:hypothetical protein [Inquilinus sp. CA228]|uniref:hypothetical protein n=1 Tax=Inquilinus sp. CA228 TaxID=3455609 RepID=UPI003F8D876D